MTTILDIFICEALVFNRHTVRYQHFSIYVAKVPFPVPALVSVLETIPYPYPPKFQCNGAAVSVSEPTSISGLVITVSTLVPTSVSVLVTAASRP
jgi:hypothetical protein